MLTKSTPVKPKIVGIICHLKQQQNFTTWNAKQTNKLKVIKQFSNFECIYKTNSGETEKEKYSSKRIFPQSLKRVECRVVSQLQINIS